MGEGDELDEVLGDGPGGDAAEESPDAGHGDEEGDVGVAHGDAHLPQVVHHGEPRADAHQERREHEPEVQRHERLRDRVLLPEHRLLAGAARLRRRRRRRLRHEERGGRALLRLLDVGVRELPRLHPGLPRHVRRHRGGGREEHKEDGHEDGRHDPAASPDAGEVGGEEVQRDGDGERVDCGEAPPILLLLLPPVRAAAANLPLAEEHHGDRAHRGRHDGEHDEERGRVVGEERGADVGEDRRAEPHIALEQPGHRPPAPAEVADAGDEHGGVHPRRAVPAEAEEDAHLPVGQRRDGPGHDEPLRAVAEEALEGADGEEKPGGDAVGGEAGEEAERLADVLGDGEAVELQLGEAHERLDGVGVVGEGVVVAGDALHPHRRHEPQPPPPPRPRHRVQRRRHHRAGEVFVGVVAVAVAWTRPRRRDGREAGSWGGETCPFPRDCWCCVSYSAGCGGVAWEFASWLNKKGFSRRGGVYGSFFACKQRKGGDEEGW
ncbi:Os09g0536800 [Oryza sativa Japonica Group]|uniref:Os09g0536800 protein n=2 Tax=Oryza sativa subsp. japonica TaxID=39947 RepID=A0A0P0XQM4_ORYSJ|nr:hypothetical protein EE612_049179 [Oryza sativa]BAD34228.1 unknown protein [Oryza sativa Japonica Group]BAD34365.1 unknown protein [Oryza sativa Japonica Group]BAF25702.1 Os09g0536800 [Oryza sativa Japonica Group]BAT09161.1 Os09g0536800 [Oryza sativa Japonica Group]|eukprot:NP_001063788.1 Os09g0536800 [Oryza sativa Japonica Group]